ncbi:calpain D [Aphelenchoides avenae]|nr:calpain D [Aphelenchus avenae]KAH7696005.1 calpain D [Aphelenchus avenae]
MFRANNQTFVDDGFPHSNRSIGNVSDLERRDLDIVWLRPQQIVTRDGMKYPWSVFNDPQPTDIEQGHVGNCWAIAALAVIAERPDILDKIMLTKTYAQYGVYQIRLCIDGIWQTVVVDDFFPCHRRSHTMIFAVGRKNQLWVSLIEKGMAKMYGNYSLLRAGRSVEGLAAFTGAPCLFIDLEPDEHFEKSSAGVKKAALDEIWAKLLSSREANFVMGTSCGAGRRALDEQEYTRVGLMSRHAYSILDVRQLDNHRLVRLRNPWGAFAWKGEWGVGWAGWTSALRKRLNTTDAPGTFWMPFEKFIHYFDSVDIAQIRNMHGWKAVRVPVEIGWDERKCGAVRMVLAEPTEVCVTLFQRNARTVLDQVDLMVAIHYEDPATHGPGELAVRSARRIQPNVRTEDVFLPAGRYIVTAFSFAKFDDKTVPGTIVIHSSRKVSAEVFMAGPNVLQQSLVSLVLKEGRAEELVSGCITRYVTDDFAGLLLMVDNVLSDHCLQVQSDCNRSLNVLSTRSTLVAIDSVPPLHRQILTILSHFEPSSHYVVEHRLSQRFVKYGQLRDYAPQSPETQNLPPFTSAAVFALHGPKPLYA